MDHTDTLINNSGKQKSHVDINANGKQRKGLNLASQRGSALMGNNNAEKSNPVYTVCNKHNNKILAIIVTTVNIKYNLKQSQAQSEKNIFDEDVAVDVGWIK